MSKLTATDIIHVLTPYALAKAVGVDRNTVTAHKKRDKLPASWYLVVKQMCAEKGIEAPDSAFKMKGQFNGDD